MIGWINTLWMSVYLNIELKYTDIHKNGIYLPKLNWILINNNLPEKLQEITILHELGHAALQQGETELYHTTYNLHAKMEADANKFMLQEEVTSYLAENGKDGFNAVSFLERYNLPLNFEGLVSDMIAGM